MLLKRNGLWSFLHRVVHGMFLALPLSSLEIPRFGTVPLIFRLHLGSRTELLGRERVTKLSMWPLPMLSLLVVLPTLLFLSITWFGDGKALKNSFFSYGESRRMRFWLMSNTWEEELLMMPLVRFATVGLRSGMWPLLWPHTPSKPEGMTTSSPMLLYLPRLLLEKFRGL